MGDEQRTFSLLARGPWTEGGVRATWGASTFAPGAEGMKVIEEAWAEASRRPGISLFDGAMCRLESFGATPAALELVLSPISYKPFFGTNLSHPELVEKMGVGAMANPVGMSVALRTADDFLLMGVRNSRVAYYPDRIHPFAGALEPGDASNVFDGIRRELREELSLSDVDVSSLACLGLAQDSRLRQPELIFSVSTALRRAEVEGKLDQAEHDAVFALPASVAAIEELLKSSSRLTPIAAATLTLWALILPER